MRDGDRDLPLQTVALQSLKQAGAQLPRRLRIEVPEALILLP